MYSEVPANFSRINKFHIKTVPEIIRKTDNNTNTSQFFLIRMIFCIEQFRVNSVLLCFHHNFLCKFFLFSELSINNTLLPFLLIQLNFAIFFYH